MATTIEVANEEARKHGHTLFGAVQHPNPKDAHLVKVMARSASDEYVVWTFNVQDRGFHHGHYSKTFTDAFKSFTAALYQMRIEEGI